MGASGDQCGAMSKSPRMRFLNSSRELWEHFVKGALFRNIGVENRNGFGFDICGSG